MVKLNSTSDKLVHAAPLRVEQLQSAVILMAKRRDEIVAMHPRDQAEIARMATTIATKVSQTFVDIYGPGTVEAANGRVSTATFYGWTAEQDFDLHLEAFRRGCSQVVARLDAGIEMFEERLAATTPGSVNQVLRAYEQLDLHAEIERASGKLYRDGHYANAIEDAVKALNALVRMRSGRDDLDGVGLMQTVFSPNNPILKFNPLADQSDQDEQKGFMMLFSGAVAGLRNPRAHKLIQDDPERALEFVAFISLLAKLLDEATK
jgi:uncharacterized protein (TIGR02391 family)